MLEIVIDENTLKGMLQPLFNQCNTRQFDVRAECHDPPNDQIKEQQLNHHLKKCVLLC